MSSTRPTSLPVRSAIGDGLRGALQWRLWLLWIGASLGCALIAALPTWNWLAEALNHSVQARAIANGEAPTLLLDLLLSRNAPHGVLGESTMIGAILMLLLSPLLAGATLTAIRSRSRPGFGDLLRGALSEYGPLLRMLLWSAIPLGLALLVMSVIIGANESAHEDAIVGAGLDTGRTVAFVVGGVLFVLAHASLEAGRGWLAADGRLRSALKAWWRGLKLLCKRPFAVLSVYVGGTLPSLLLAAALLLLRPHIGHGSVLALLLGLLLSSAVAAALGWGRIARLFGMQALADDMHARR